MSVKQLILDHLQKTRFMTQGIFADIEENAWVTQPEGIPNHPMWQLGHLAYVTQALPTMVNPDAQPIDPIILEGFGRGTTPEDTADIYPSLDEVLSSFNAGFERLIAWVETLDDAALLAPREFPNPIMGKNLAELLLFISLHETLHAGQVTTWRRARNMPSWLDALQASLQN